MANQAKRGRPLARILLAVTLLALALTAATAAPAAALPGKFWGVAYQGAPNEERLQRLKRGGVDSLRVGIGWSTVQPTRDSAPQWATIDAQIARAARQGLDVFPFLFGAPGWAVKSDYVPGSHRSGKAPRNLPVFGSARGGWMRFVKLVVRRYGPSGDFWAENPELPRRPLRIWQIWNEPNFKYFVTRPNPGQYGKLVKYSYNAIKSVDRGAKLVLAGLFARPKEAQWKVKPPQAYFADDFLAQMFKRTPGVQSKFIGVALHPYTRNFKLLTPYIEEVRDVMKRNRAGGKGLWITELGWSSQPPTKSNLFAKGVGGQKRQLQGAFKLLRKKQRAWHIKRIYWFSAEDQQGGCNFCDGSGLFTEDFESKPSWYAYVRFAGGVAG